MNDNEKEILDLLEALFPNTIDKVSTEESFVSDGNEICGEGITVYLKNGKIFELIGTEFCDFRLTIIKG